VTLRARVRILGVVLAALVVAAVAVGVVLTTGSGQLTGRVVDENGEPVAGCGIAPSGPTFHRLEFGITSGYDGRWSYGEVRNGPYFVTVVCADAGQEGSSAWGLVRGDTAVDVVTTPVNVAAR